MRTYWHVRITYELPITEPVHARFPLFETLDGVIAALRKATGVTIPLRDDPDGFKSWAYDQDGGPFVPGISLITVSPLKLMRAESDLSSMFA
jgi:hypothetical protein